jgi:hypothetical protein
VIIETIRAVLLEDAPIMAAFGPRIYPTQLPDAPTYPAIVLTKVTGRGEYDYQGDIGLEEARVQVDVYSEDGMSDVIAKKTLVRRRLSGFTGGPSGSPPSCAIQTCMCITDSDFPVSDTERAGPRLRRRLLEFLVWNTEV